MSEAQTWLGRSTMILRAGFFSLLLMALAEPMIHLPEQRTDWLFLVDHSDSMTPAGLDKSIEYVERMAAEMPTGDRIALMSFGR